MSATRELREGDATVVMVRRERHGAARRALTALFARTPPLVPIVYVDAGSPRTLARWVMRAAASRPGLRIARVASDAPPNEGRRAGLSQSSSRYVAFVDNDVVVEPGWLEALVRCADDTGAAIVGPLVLMGTPRWSLVHFAGGDLELTGSAGARSLREVHHLANARPSDLRGRLERRRTGVAEMHVLLVRRAALEEVGGFDPGLKSTMEHTDLCLRVRAAGHEVYFEPACVITVLPPLAPLLPAELRYYLLRWSERWNRDSVEHMRRKHAIAPNDPFLRAHLGWLRRHRWLGLSGVQLLRLWWASRRA